MNKWIGLSLGTLVGLSHIGMIGYVATSNKNQLPSLDIPVGDYTSYEAEVGKKDIGLVINLMILRQCISPKTSRKVVS